MTKTAFLQAYRSELEVRYDWAGDNTKLDRFMSSVETTITTTTSTWNYDGDAVTSAWRKIGCKGKPTLKALRALPN
jgi:hypothetical protein